MKDLYNPKESFDKYLNSARYSAELKNNEAMLKDMLCALEELQAWMEKVEEKLGDEK